MAFAFLGFGDRVITSGEDHFRIWSLTGSSTIPFSRANQASLLVGSPAGTHLAFFVGERFYVLDMGGNVVWSRRINTDKAIPLDIVFSPTGDAVAGLSEYDGARRLHFHSLQ